MQEHIENDPHYQGLTVNEGVERLPIVNPYRKKIRRHQYTVDEYVNGILAGDKVMLSQAVTLVESTLPAHQEIADQIIERCLPYAGKSERWGITGVPGAGKSTSIEALGMSLIRQGKKLAVWLSTPVASAVRVVFWAIKPVWKNCRYKRMPLSVLRPQLVLWVVWPAKHANR